MLRLHADMKQLNRSWIIAMILFLFPLIYIFLLHSQPVVLPVPLHDLPYVFGQWRGEDIHDREKQFRIDGADSELNRIYRNADGREVQVYIGYFATQKQDKELITYKLGDLYENAKEITIQIDTLNNIQANKTITTIGIQQALAIYWYNLNGQIIANNNKAKLITSIGGLLHRRTNGAFIIISGKFIRQEEVDKLFVDEIEFAKIFLPFLQKHFS